MAEFYNISDWNERLFYQTGGTRNKVVVENPEDHVEYYFKTSLKKEKLDYKYEFWSEIIASEIGSLLGFNTLRYDIAFNTDEIGCLSKSMVTQGQNMLNEGINYLTGYDASYNPKDKKSKIQYTFHFISESLKHFKLDKYIKEIVEIIIFDSIIGNGDRHQENWGVITDYNEVIKAIKDSSVSGVKGVIKRLLVYFLNSSDDFKEVVANNLINNLGLLIPTKFAQIYDSGSCLGRELNDNKAKQMISDPNMLEAYIRRGVSEIHWEGEKLNHFELIRRINQIHPSFVKKTIERVEEKHDESEIKSIIQNIDLNLPKEYSQYKLPVERKEFIIKLIALRIQKLIKLKQ